MALSDRRCILISSDAHKKPRKGNLITYGVGSESDDVSVSSIPITAWNYISENTLSVFM